MTPVNPNTAEGLTAKSRLDLRLMWWSLGLATPLQLHRLFTEMSVHVKENAPPPLSPLRYLLTRATEKGQNISRPPSLSWHSNGIDHSSEKFDEVKKKKEWFFFEYFWTKFERQLPTEFLFSLGMRSSRRIQNYQHHQHVITDHFVLWHELLGQCHVVFDKVDTFRSTPCCMWQTWALGGDASFTISKKTHVL